MDSVNEIRAALNEQKGAWPDIALNTGLSYWWVIKFGQGRIREPGALKLEKLRLYLSALPSAGRAAAGEASPPKEVA